MSGKYNQENKKSSIKIISLGLHTITVLFNRVPIPETPLRVNVETKKMSDESIEERKYQINKSFIILILMIFIGSTNKSPRTNSVEQRGRSSHPKQHSQERARSLSTQTNFDSIHSRLSKSNENLTQPTSQKPSSTDETQRGERMTKSEDRQLSNTQLTEQQILKFNALKDKFQQKQPIDNLFGMKN